MSLKTTKKKPLVIATQQQTKTCSKSVTSLLMGMGIAVSVAIPAIAAQTTSSTTTTTTQTTPAPVGSSTNVASPATLNTTTNAAAANGSSPATNTAAQPTNQSMPTVTSDTKKEALKCADVKNPDGLGAAMKVIYEREMKQAAITPSVDEIFNPKEKNAATQGCFTASTEIVNLADLVPTVNLSWGNIGTMVQEQVKKQIANVQQQMINRGCSIANQAVVNAMKPINEYLKKLQESSNMLNNTESILGAYLTSQIDAQFGKLDLTFNQLVDGVQADVDKSIADAAAKYGNTAGVDRVNATLGQYPTGNVNTNISQANVAAQQQELQLATEYRNQIIASKPPQIGTAVDNSSGKPRTVYCKFLVPNQCTQISPAEYSDLTLKTDQYQTNLSIADARVQKAQAALQGAQAAATANANKTPTTTNTSGGSSFYPDNGTSFNQAQPTTNQPANAGWNGASNNNTVSSIEQSSPSSIGSIGQSSVGSPSQPGTNPAPQNNTNTGNNSSGSNNTGNSVTQAISRIFQ